LILKNDMNILVTGSNGFIGKNLITHLNELGMKVTEYSRRNKIEDLSNLVKKADFIIHLAGENRPNNQIDFVISNIQLTERICEAILFSNKKIPLIFASSIQADYENAYGKSKIDAEKILKKFEANSGNPIYIYRLPGVFGKWCKPNYNSVVATFCYNISRNLSIRVDDQDKELSLIYIDDLVNEFIRVIIGKGNITDTSIEDQIHKIKLGQLEVLLNDFKNSRESSVLERVGSGFASKLYSTYVSYLPPSSFSYEIPSHADERGVFAEFLKTKDSGQFSFFTAKAGVTRGGHYHHSKTEKFLVIQGRVRFRFRHIISDEAHEIITSGNKLKIVETVPGWSHNITNIGTEEMVVMLWANEIFDPDNPDTITHKV
jgi:UDP-2-acetamido-2,6-beta-L-arabino-hexul-4-ose reductase